MTHLAVITPERIEAAEAALLPLPQVECPVTHSFGPGIYMREVLLPAGTFAVGHHHNEAHMNMVLCGRLTLANADGTFTEVCAPAMLTTPAGRKVAFVHEDTVWVNVYATTETDVEALEAKYLTKSPTFLAHEQSRLDVLRLAFDGPKTECPPDWSVVYGETDMPHGSYRVMVSESTIHGRGLFATGSMTPGTLIAPALIEAGTTPAGRYANHSDTPNAAIVNRGDGADLIAILPIAGCSGGWKGEEITVDYRQALRDMQ